MAVYEKRPQRNGVPLSVQYILMQQAKKRRVPKLHYHEYTELLFGISGRAVVCVGDRRFELPAGAMAIIHNDVPHDVISNGEPSSYHVIKFLPQILLTGGQTYSEYSYVLMLMEHISDKQFLFESDELAGTEVPVLFGRVMEEWDRQEFGYELSLRADVTRIFLYILRRWREKNRPLVDDAFLSGQKELMQKAVSYIQEHYNDLTEEETATACGVSAAYLSRTFKRSMKTSFSAYVTNVRLREAERLLLTTDDSVTDIAQTVGFSTSAYFIARFRDARKTTPYRYRRMYRDES